MLIFISLEESIRKYKNLHSEMERWPSVTDMISQFLAVAISKAFFKHEANKIEN